jgi:hypothetical protein
MRHVLAAVILGLLFGCAREPGQVLALTAESNEPAVIAEAERVLMARFEEFPASWLSSIESCTAGSELTFVFKGGAPDPVVLDYLYSTPGVFRVSLANGFRRDLFDSRDLRDVVLRFVDSSYRLALRLTPEAGARVMKATSENIGQVAMMTLDGKVLVEAQISAPFGEFLEVTLPGRPSRVAELVAVLKSGALPTGMSLARDADGI